MKRGRTFSWIPLWVDKWLWGSTRHELAHDERAVFIDLLALASKDDGYIRANPITPYPLDQLAGMLCAPRELLERTISSSKRFGKIVEPSDGVFRIASWQDYQLSDRRKRDLNPDDKSISEKAEPISEKADPIHIQDTDTNTDTNTETHSPDGEDIRLVQLLIDLMLQNNPESGIIKRLTPERQADWINQCRLLREIDHRTPEQIEALIRWTQADSFWKSNILSIRKLREKWDQLWMKARRGDKFSGIRAFVNEDNDDKQ